jgi:P4 family phage/plasmid primase-like protien
MIYEEGSFWNYEKTRGIWTAIRPEQLEDIGAAFSGSPVVSDAGKTFPLNLSQRKISGAIKLLRAKLIANKTWNFDARIPGVTFSNGFVVVMNGHAHLHHFGAQCMSRHAFPFPYIHGAPHPLLDAFFCEVFQDTDPFDRSCRIALIQEFLGICLVGAAPKYQCALLLFGIGANGKSQLLEIAYAMFPPDAVAAVPPQQWAQRFQIAALVGKLINLCNEIPETKIVANALFKSVITGEPVHAERKGRDPFAFRPEAGHIFSANRLPATTDQSLGFWRRLIPCVFSRNMREAPCHTPDIGRKIVEAELPAIVSWALEGACRVQAQGDFTRPPSSAVVLQQWRKDVDSVVGFLESECVVDASSRTPSAVVYERYSDWAYRNGLQRVSSPNFFRRVNELGYRSKHGGVANYYELRVR